MERENRPADGEKNRDEADEELATTASGWRSGLGNPEDEDAAEEVARGAERAAGQPGYGREGS